MNKQQLLKDLIDAKFIIPEHIALTANTYKGGVIYGSKMETFQNNL